MAWQDFIDSTWEWLDDASRCCLSVAERCHVWRHVRELMPTFVLGGQRYLYPRDWITTDGQPWRPPAWMHEDCMPGDVGFYEEDNDRGNVVIAVSGPSGYGPQLPSGGPCRPMDVL